MEDKESKDRQLQEKGYLRDSDLTQEEQEKLLNDTLQEILQEELNGNSSNGKLSTNKVQESKLNDTSDETEEFTVLEPEETNVNLQPSKPNTSINQEFLPDKSVHNHFTAEKSNDKKKKLETACKYDTPDRRNFFPAVPKTYKQKYFSNIDISKRENSKIKVSERLRVSVARNSAGPDSQNEKSKIGDEMQNIKYNSDLILVPSITERKTSVIPRSALLETTENVIKPECHALEKLRQPTDENSELSICLEISSILQKPITSGNTINVQPSNPSAINLQLSNPAAAVKHTSNMQETPPLKPLVPPANPMDEYLKTKPLSPPLNWQRYQQVLPPPHSFRPIHAASSTPSSQIYRPIPQYGSNVVLAKSLLKPFGKGSVSYELSKLKPPEPKAVSRQSTSLPNIYRANSQDSTSISRPSNYPFQCRHCSCYFATKEELEEHCILLHNESSK